jgi:uncharacterized protein YndB with AHSA1/START domain
MTTMKLTDITVSRTIPATPGEIYDVWMDSKTPGGPWYGCQRVIMNPVVDGLFYHAVEHAGRTWAHYGRFIRLDRATCIEFAWMSEATKGAESVVTAKFEARGESTEVILRHSGVPDDELGRQHKDGWTWMLSMIEERFAKGAAGATE